MSSSVESSDASNPGDIWQQYTRGTKLELHSWAHSMDKKHEQQ